MAGLVLLLGLLAGCLGSRSAENVPPDQRFGHRYEDEAPDGRRTLSITPADSNTAYFYYPATFDSVNVRPAPLTRDVPTTSQAVEVEVLVKGAFPDACMELHQVEQERVGNIITATLEMRKPQEAICASVRRPYRFYVMLEGRYDIGHYTFKLNDKVYPFEVRLPNESVR